MEKHQYDNPLRRQCESLASLCAEQIAGVKSGLTESIPQRDICGIRHVIVTGCGDSYFAARACLPAFNKFNNAFGNSFLALRCIDVARNYTFKPGDNAATLVVGVSASGSPARVKEALLHAREHGCRTMIITNNPESPGALAAEFALIVNTPSFPESSPGLRNYYASLVGLYALAAYMGEAKDIAPQGAMEGLFGAITNFTAAYGKEFERMDSAMFSLAVSWKDFPAFESIGDNINFSTACFIAAKFVETAGIMAPTNDSENWCHVNYFASDAETIGTIVVANKNEKNRSRIAETVFQAHGVGRPVLFITDGTAADYNLDSNTGVQVCTVPAAPAAYAFLQPLLQHVPGTLLASYISKLHNEPYFRGEFAPQRMTPYGSSIGTSSVEI